MNKCVIWKKLALLVIIGYAVGCVAFVAALFAGSIAHGGANVFVSKKTGEGLVKLAIFCIILGISTCAAGIIHEVKNLALSLKCLIQMAVYVVVYLIGAYFIGWIEKRGITRYILVALVGAVAGWLGSMVWSMVNAHKINQKIKERERKDSNMG